MQSESARLLKPQVGARTRPHRGIQLALLRVLHQAEGFKVMSMTPSAAPSATLNLSTARVKVTHHQSQAGPELGSRRRLPRNDRGIFVRAGNHRRG
jgi:hypothetical protein